MSFESCSLLKAVLKQPGHQWFDIGERGDALTEVTGRQDAKLLA